jgi:SAM-dependent methyltransferase
MSYLKLAEHYDKCFKEHGDTHLGVDWPKLEDTFKRYDVMLGLIKEETSISLLDFGCGTASLNQYIEFLKIKNIKYSGLDINDGFYNTSKLKFPNNDFYCLDILKNESIPNFDYIVCNGPFTEKRDLSQEEMMDFFTSVIKKLWNKCDKGIAFNLMSKHVDWERDDLFHVSLDELGWFLKNNLSRNFIIRNDYGLYEYTAYVYK